MSTKAFFATEGKAKTQFICRPFAVQHVWERGSWWGSVLARYTQAKRHAMGHQTVFYALWKLGSSASTPVGSKILALRSLNMTIFPECS